MVRLAGAVDDMPAAYAAATVVVSAAVQPEGLQRAILEAQAMARPVVISDLAAGPEAVLAPPSVPEERMTGLRVPAGDEAALAAALIRLFSLTDAARAAIGTRGRAWVATHFDAAGRRPGRHAPSTPRWRAAARRPMMRLPPYCARKSPFRDGRAVDTVTVCPDLSPSSVATTQETVAIRRPMRAPRPSRKTARA